MIHVYYHDTMFVSSLMCLALIRDTMGDMVFELDLKSLLEVHVHAYPVIATADTVDNLTPCW